MVDERPATIGELLGRQSAADASAHPAELAQLETCLHDSGPLVAWVYGAAGTGKTALIEAFSRRAEAAGARLIRIDCRLVEPTESGLLAALAEMLRSPVDSARTVAAALSVSGQRTVIAFDNYEVFRLADSWLRREFIPALSADMRVVLVSREPPAAGWISAAEWRQFFLNIPLGRPPGDEPDVRASALLDDVSDPATRRALEAVCVVRRITRPMLAALCPDDSADALYERLAQLEFVERRRDGLALQEIVHRAIGGRLQARDPERYRRYQQSAWQILREQLRNSPRADLWRFTADAIYLIENPVIREAFFPSESAQFSIEPAMPGDRQAVLALSARYESEIGRDALELWWKHLPGAFHVVRDASGSFRGFYCMAKPDELDGAWLRFDPIARNWQDHLFRKGRSASVPSLFLRRWLSESAGESPCAEQAASWVDIKRTYLELRPELRRVYMTLQDIGPYGPAATQLGFRVLEDLAVGSDDSVYHSAMLDFGPGSVDGWICDLVAAELGIVEDQLLDHAAHELLLNGDRIHLTPLEFGVVSMLESRAGEPVSRGELLQQVWGHGHEGGSNVVDAVIRGLRRKCGSHAEILETVRGVGYRLRS